MVDFYKFLQISGELVNNLLSGCVECGAVLNITNIVSEKKARAWKFSLCDMWH